jgi:23S rRNA pseudouridine2605 synthase
LGQDVKGLERVSFAGLTTQGVPRGTWRSLSRSEVRYLREQVGLERKTDAI